jgi:hypothetical protein
VDGVGWVETVGETVEVGRSDEEGSGEDEDVGSCRLWTMTEWLVIWPLVS